MKVEADFIQFYTVELNNKLSEKVYYISNAFNCIHDRVNARWVDIRRKNSFRPLHEKVFVSVWFFPQHQNTVVDWARKFPGNKFVVGGPLYQTDEIRVFVSKKKEKWPTNIYFTTETIEEYFKIPVDLKKWELKFNGNEHKKCYSYYIGTDCPWRGCSFCYARRQNSKRSGYDIEPLYDAPKGIVVLSSPAASPEILKDVLPRLNYRNKIYIVYVRADDKTLSALKEIGSKLPPKRITFGVGVEFPSDRMLDKMNKGITLQENINFINFTKEIGATVSCFFIHGWPQIEKPDVESARGFFGAIAGHKRINHIYGRLTTEYEIPPVEGVLSNKKMKFLRGYSPQLNEEKTRIDDEFVQLLKDNGAVSRKARNLKRACHEFE